MNKLTLIVLLGLLFTFSFAAITNCAELTGAEAEEEEAAEPAEGGERRLADETCAKCEDGFGLNNDAKECKACSVTNCATCPNAPGTCTGCKDGFVASGTTKCEACKDTNCKTCAAGTAKCDTCKSGYTLLDDEDKALDQCTACANGCSECATVGASCASCPTGQEKNSTNKENVFCCATNCSTCSTTSACLTCKSGSTLNSDNACVFGFKTGASLTLGAVVSVALLSLLF